MQQTEQFKLNQWQKDDRILMEDFNADNLKIENALADVDKRAGHGEGIPVDLSSRGAHIFTHCNFLQWNTLSIVHLIINAVTTNGQPLDLCYRTRASNGHKSVKFGTMYCNASADEESRVNTLHITMFPMFDEQSKVSMLISGADPSGFVILDISYKDFYNIAGERSVSTIQVLPGSYSRIYTWK